jgi:hypothetical protein
VLQYLVLDELHTYDGAQWADVACLIRRLKERLSIPKGELCVVGTSANLNDWQSGKVGIAAGIPIDNALEEMFGLTTDQVVGSEIEGTGDFSNIDQSPNFELVLVEGEEHLKDILEASLEEWRSQGADQREPGIEPLEQRGIYGHVVQAL